MEATTHTRWPAAGYAATIFLSAFLLFQIQPLVSKTLLPWFGGSPAVWTTCLLFFQTLLFVGYASAHLSHAWLRPKTQAVLYIAILCLAILLMRVLPGDRWAPSADKDPVWQILGILAATVGLPYLVLSATGPLMQAWFNRSFPTLVPYRLYALSNFGSLLALLTYPFAFERIFDLPQQARVWSWGFGIFALVAACAATRNWATTSLPAEQFLTAQVVPRPSWTQNAWWIAFPAFAVIVLMATTNHISTDVAAMPFLWVVPLTLYLTTFIIAFERPRWHRPALVAAITFVAIYGSALMHREGTGRINLYDCGMTGRCIRLVAEAFQYDAENGGGDAEFPAPRGPRANVGFLSFLATNFLTMFGICLICHGELARRRPHPRYLTAYYLMIAAGGALGGTFVALIVPNVFNTLMEWKLAMFLASIAMLGLLLHALVHRALPTPDSSSVGRFAMMPMLALILLLLPTSFLLLDLVEYLYSPKKGVQFQSRNFFGTLTIRERNPDNPQMHNLVLLHGTIVHGAQFVAPNRRGQPITYYSSPSGIGRVLNYYRTRSRSGGIDIGAVGLGTGTLAAYAGAGDSIRFYEIDPAVIELATGGRWFTYVSESQARGAETEIKQGDARLLLEEEARGGQAERYHVLVLDAFSGDAIPIHLLTAEAFELYLARLAAEADGENGSLAVHVSNRYLDLATVVRGAAERFGIESVHIHTRANPSQSINSADWIILSHNRTLMRELRHYGRVADEAARPPVFWTDAQSSLFDVLK